MYETQNGLLELAGVLGLTLKERETHLDVEQLVELLTSLQAELRDQGEPELIDSIGAAIHMHFILRRKEAANTLIEVLIDIREKLRSKKRWQLADGIRSSLLELGIVLEDNPEGTTWRYRGW